MGYVKGTKAGEPGKKCITIFSCVCGCCTCDCSAVAQIATQLSRLLQWWRNTKTSISQFCL